MGLAYLIGCATAKEFPFVEFNWLHSRRFIASQPSEFS